MIHLLDSNVVIAALKRDHRVLERLGRARPDDVALSSIVIHELYFGGYRGERRAANLAIFDALGFEILPFDREDARKAGELRAHLAARGTPIGPYDVLIAGQALARDLTLVTRNIRGFARVPGLRLENWQDASGEQ